MLTHASPSDERSLRPGGRAAAEHRAHGCLEGTIHVLARREFLDSDRTVSMKVRSLDQRSNRPAGSMRLHGLKGTNKSRFVKYSGMRTPPAR